MFDIGLLVPIIAVLIPIVAIVANTINRISRDALRQKTIAHYLDQGLQPPQALFEKEWNEETKVQDAASKGAKNNGLLISGLVNLMAGPALMVFFYYIVAPRYWVVGLIPFAIGVGLLLAWRIIRQDLARTAPVQPE